MKHSLLFLFAALCLLITPAFAHANSAGVPVICNDGTGFDNGVEVVVSQMRSGFTYTATAIGLNGFDPVLAVLDKRTGNGLCNDDEGNAARYGAALPTTGRVPASNLSAQVNFAQNISSDFADVSLVVGGYNNQSGEFLLILEGMAVTSGDGAGDVFRINVTPGMVASGIPLTVYMITRGQSNVDPLLYLADDDLNPLSDSDDYTIYCDDAGSTENCYTPLDMSSSTVTIDSGRLPTWDKDAELSLSLDNVTLDDDPDMNFLNYVMTSYNHETHGQYLLVFHIGTTLDNPKGNSILDQRSG